MAHSLSLPLIIGSTMVAEKPKVRWKRRHIRFDLLVLTFCTDKDAFFFKFHSFIANGINLSTAPLKGGDCPLKLLAPSPLLGSFPSIEHVQNVIFGTYARNAGLLHLHMYE